jgi:hypothetical protein
MERILDAYCDWMVAARNNVFLVLRILTYIALGLFGLACVVFALVCVA